MAIQDFHPKEAAMGSRVAISMGPPLVAGPDQANFVTVKVGEAQAEFNITPDKMHIFITVPNGLKAGEKYRIEVKDIQTLFTSPTQLEIKGDDNGGEPGAGEITVTNVSPPKIVKTTTGFRPPRITLHGTNLHLVTSARLDKTRIVGMEKEEKTLIMPLRRTLPKPQNIAGYKIRLTYGHDGKTLKVSKRVKVSKE